MEKVGFGPRLVAYLIDAVIVGIVYWVITLVFSLFGSDVLSMIGGLIAFVFAVGYYIYFWGTSGQTPGKSVMKIKVVSTDGSKPTMGKAVLRLIGYVISGAIIYIGFLWILIDANKQGWHDKIAGTYVVKA